MSTESPNISKHARTGRIVLLICFIILGLYLYYTYFVNGDYVGMALFAVWGILLWAFISLFTPRRTVNATPVPEDERAWIQQIAQECGATFRDIWNLTDDPPPYPIGVLGALPGRHHLFMDLDWFEQLPPSQQKAAIVLAVEKTVRRNRPAKTVGLYLGMLTLYLIHHFMTVSSPDPASLWGDIGPELLVILGVLLVLIHGYREVFEIDRVVADETSAQALKALLEDDSGVASNTAVKLTAALSQPIGKKRLEKLDGLSQT